jgi:NADH-quinone oxidoreductase subunit N
MNRLMPILPELILTVGALALMMVAAFAGRRASGATSLLAVVLLIVATFALIGPPSNAGPLFGGLIAADAFGAFGKVIIFLASAVAIIAAHSWFERGTEHAPEYSVLILFSAIGGAVMVSATSLMTLYVGLELMSQSSYVLASYRRSDERSAEAGLKYFVLGALASGILLYGISLLYGFTGTMAFPGIAAAFAREGTHSIGLLFGLVFLLAGIAFKVSAVPFHMWTPDVYEGAPTPVTALFAVAPKIAAMSLMVSVLMGPFKPLFFQWQQIVVVASVLSMALGAFAALRQQNIKRLMAYSSIGNVGYVLLGLASGSEKGIQAVVFYLAIYMVMTLGVFAIILMMKRRDVMVENVSDLAGLARSEPMMALALLIFMFSLAGIPPLAGFWGKLYIFIAAVEAKLYVPAVLGVLASVVASYYYLRIVKVMYFDEPAEALDRPIFSVNRAVAFVAAILVAVFSLAPQPLSLVAAAAAKGLFP